jgi:hypothetical protein
MPIKIDRARTQALALQFDEALELVRNEFEGSIHTDSTVTSSLGYRNRIHSDVG